MRRSCGAVALVVAVSLSAVFPAVAAESESWAVASANGAVTIDGQAAGATASTIGPGAMIETGADGSVMLTRPGDSITVFPNSRSSVPVSDSGAEPGILQTLGKLLFRMESRESRDFEIKTPYLAAAIKGTTFTVEVGEGDTAVEASEGSVLVIANRSGQSAYVGPGGRASVGRDDGDFVKVTVIRDERGVYGPQSIPVTEPEPEPQPDTSAVSRTDSTGGNQSNKKDSPSGDSGKGNDPGSRPGQNS